MTTLAILKRSAKEHFIPGMKERGFTYSAKHFLFYRERNGIYYFLTPSTTTGGHAKFFYFAWAKELYLGEFDMSKFPKIGGMPTGDSLSKNGREGGGKLWNVDSVDDQIKAFEEVLELVDSFINPWFESIDSGDRLIQELLFNWQEDEEFEDICKYIATSNLGSDKYNAEN